MTIENRKQLNSISEINLGDIVYLNSGSPRLTVSQFSDPDRVTLTFMNTDNKVDYFTTNVKCLSKY